MRTSTADHHFRDKIVRIILKILRYLSYEIKLQNSLKTQLDQAKSHKKGNYANISQ